MTRRPPPIPEAAAARRQIRVVRSTRGSGFTLVELLVAATLIGIVLGSGAVLTFQVGEARQRGQRMATHHAEADAALRALTDTLPALDRSYDEDDLVFIGEDLEENGQPADRLRLRITSNRTVRPDQPESDVHEIEFYLETPSTQELPVLVRRTDPTRNEPPDDGGVIEVVARDIVSFNVEYLDQGEWVPDWPEFLNRYPTALRLAVGVAIPDRETERIYRRLVYWPAMPGSDAAGDGLTPDEATTNPADAPDGGGF